METKGWQYDWKFDWEDGTALERGTLVPEEYVFDLRFVQRVGLSEYSPICRHVMIRTPSLVRADFSLQSWLILSCTGCALAAVCSVREAQCHEGATAQVGRLRTLMPWLVY